MLRFVQRLACAEIVCGQMRARTKVAMPQNQQHEGAAGVDDSCHGASFQIRKMLADGMRSPEDRQHQETALLTNIVGGFLASRFRLSGLLICSMPSRYAVYPLGASAGRCKEHPGEIA